ncbi:MAG: GH3 auxin-responsive promoter family protein [Candidatus Bathyarchaeota archaeon]|nr:GH3 auxin-responsive promoter family protein [Candidatus Bathyarchaeota archaeon]MDH5494460.1 GH3 auxin-responsive promoter family protein [Candidatus Bathyarchaeota archaeon]
MMFPKISPDDFLRALVNPWYQALENPTEAQNQALQDLIEHYRKTDYGEQHSINDIKNIADFQLSFPKISYEKLLPHLKEVKKGNYRAMLSEPPVCWVMTRGSTGVSKILPATKTHLEQIFSCGARALVNYALRENDFTVLIGKVLNLNFPSTVATMETSGKRVNYGYSSGTYAKLNPMLNQVSLLPKQEEIDALGLGITRSDWEKRFELVYQKALNQNVTAAMGVTPVILSFAKYVANKHRKKPKELWRLKALFCTSIRKIQHKYAPRLKSYYGTVPIVEMYTATEGVYGQQLDDLPYISPNYDKYLFEVETGQGIKMLYELKRGEWGRLIVSSCLFPRYDIGDMIEAMGKNYFRVFGRATALTILEHRLYRLLYGWLL